MFEEMLPERRWDKSVLFLISDREPVKKCLHAIRRDEGKHFKVSENTKICSQHFRKGDIRNVSRGKIATQGKGASVKKLRTDSFE